MIVRGAARLAKGPETDRLDGVGVGVRAGEEP